ncbi:MAG: hypothetical protein J3R72DRAFT_440088 [Linnemannia gamsii]|nr:MAG: hypothetical protein J3R72DRAFT_440088 [Linnemannia gamsii]
MLKLVISNVPRPDCKKTQYRARLSLSRNGTKGITGGGGDVEEQALRIQREICRQLGMLTKLQVLWLGRETRDFGNLDNYRVVSNDRRQDLGLPKRDPHYGDDKDEDEDDEQKDEVDEVDTEEKESEEEEIEYEDDIDYDMDNEYDYDADADKHGNPLMYPLMLLNSRFQFSCVPLSLDSGLDLMSEQKDLRELNVEQMADRIGLEVVRCGWWVSGRNWRRSLGCMSRAKRMRR